MTDTETSGVPPVPFVRLRWQGGEVLQTGAAACSLGCPVGSADRDSEDGVFVHWVWREGELTVRNDRYGFFPVYYYATPDEIAVSPSLPQLMTLRRGWELDADAMAVFLRLGYFLQEDTPFTGIRALPPGAVLTWRPGRVRLTDHRPRIMASDLTRRDARDAFIDLFRQAMARRMPENGVATVPLSGGKDSRHILLELSRSGVRTTCITMALRGNDDVEIASALAQEVGVHHLTIEPPTARIMAELRKNEATNFCADEHGWYMPVADRLRMIPGPIYDGLGGDVLSCSANLSESRVALYRTGRLEDLARGLWPVSTEGVLKNLLPEAVYARFDAERALARLVDELGAHMDAPNPVGSFFFFNRTRREVALIPYAMLRDAGPVYTPFIDHDLYDMLAGLPAERLLDRKLHSDAILHAYPEVAHIPFATGRPKAETRAERWRYGRDLLTYLLTGPRPQLIRTTYLIPRAVRYMTDLRYRWNGNLALYLIQLERVLRHHST